MPNRLHIITLKRSGQAPTLYSDSIICSFPAILTGVPVPALRTDPVSSLQLYCNGGTHFLTGQDEGATDKRDPDIAAQFKPTRRCQAHFTLVALAGFRIVAGTVPPPVATFGGESFHYLQTENRAVPQPRIRIFPVDLRFTDRSILAVNIVRFLQPDDFSADFFSTPE